MASKKGGPVFGPVTENARYHDLPVINLAETLLRLPRASSTKMVSTVTDSKPPLSVPECGKNTSAMAEKVACCAGHPHSGRRELEIVLLTWLGVPSK